MLEEKEKMLLDKAQLKEAYAKLPANLEAFHGNYEEEHEHNVIMENVLL